MMHGPTNIKHTLHCCIGQSVGKPKCFRKQAHLIVTCEHSGYVNKYFVDSVTGNSSYFQVYSLIVTSARLCLYILTLICVKLRTSYLRGSTLF